MQAGDELDAKIKYTHALSSYVMDVADSISVSSKNRWEVSKEPVIPLSINPPKIGWVRSRK